MDRNEAAFNRMEEALDVRLGELNEWMGRHREDINELLEEKRGLRSELVGWLVLSVDDGS